MYMKVGVIALVTSNPPGLHGLLLPHLSSECLSEVSPCDFLLRATKIAESIRVVLPPTLPESLYNRHARHPSLRSDLPLWMNISPRTYSISIHTYVGRMICEFFGRVAGAPDCPTYIRYIHSRHPPVNGRTANHINKNRKS